VQNKHGNVSAMGNVARGFRNTLEDTRREGGGSVGQVGPAGPTLALADPLLLRFAPPFQKLPPLPLRSNLGPWLSRFDPMAHANPTRLYIHG